MRTALTFAFENGAFLRTDFTLRKGTGTLSLEAQVSGEGFPEFKRKSFNIVFHGASPTNMRLDGEVVLPLKNQDLTTFVLSNAGSRFLLEGELDG